MSQPIRTYYQNFVIKLQTIYEIDEAESIANIVFEELFMMKKHHILILEKDLLEEDIAQLDVILNRLIKHEPVQYVLGIADFFGLRFKVNKNVLIPRRETEELVDLIIKDVRKWKLDSGKKINILDIGTGNGCIAISLKKNMPFANLSAIDISTDAIKVATENALLNKVDIDFVEDDILQTTNNKPQTFYNIIVSNPPYITIAEKDKMLKNVLEHEPHNALFITDNNPLQFYKAIASFAKIHLNEGGKLYFEINELFGNEVKKMLTENGFQKIEIIKDMQGKDRIVKCNCDRTDIA